MAVGRHGSWTWHRGNGMDGMCDEDHGGYGEGAVVGSQVTRLVDAG